MIGSIVTAGLPGIRLRPRHLVGSLVEPFEEQWLESGLVLAETPELSLPTAREAVRGNGEY